MTGEVSAMVKDRSFDELLAEGIAAPVDGWDFSCFDARATEQRPSWGYAGLLAARVPSAGTVLDIQTGGGEVLATVPSAPDALFATESWPPNLAIARRNLAHLGGTVIEVDDHADLPFASDQFDLIVSRHPTVTGWDEIGRILKPGGSYLSQQVGAGTVRELTDAVMGPQPVSQSRSTERAVAAANAAGLEIIELRSESLPMEFYDIAAVVHILRKVIWTVPNFTVEAYRPRLIAIHRGIEADGPFTATSERFLIEARKPA
jgi:SAM-dependent methyltransferase